MVGITLVEVVEITLVEKCKLILSLHVCNLISLQVLRSLCTAVKPLPGKQTALWGFLTWERTLEHLRSNLHAMILVL